MVPTPHRCSRSVATARLGLLLLAAALIALATADPLEYVALLAVATVVAVVAAAWQVGHDDLPGWLIAIGAALWGGGLVASARVGLLPGAHRADWDLAAVAGLAGVIAVVGAALARRVGTQRPLGSRTPAA